jgi:hypothetical protein
MVEIISILAFTMIEDGDRISSFLHTSCILYFLVQICM